MESSFIKDSQEKVDFFISRARGICVYYKQVESYKGGGLTKQECVHVFCYLMNN